jgi:RNA polymerase sigma-70 factor (ECF subfamily)
METSVSFLDLLRDRTAQEPWRKLVELYSPLIRAWLKRHAAAESDVDDVTQEVLAVVVRRFPEFERQRSGSFRTWLRTIAVNCLRDQWRKGNRQPAGAGGTDFVELLGQLEDPHSGLSRQWDREHDAHVSQYLLEQVRPQFAPQTWTAFCRFALDGLAADDVAQELGITPNAVFIAKSRVMAALRQVGQGLLDDIE